LGSLEKDTDTLLKEVREAVQGIPIIAAGGIPDGKRIAQVLKNGADGVQLATIFILAEECAAAAEYKKVHQLATKPEDVILIKSPVGMPGRAIRTKFTEKQEKGVYPGVDFCDNCLKSCTAHYCIFDALRNAQKGDVDNGVVFSGESVSKIKNKTIRPAKEIIADLVKEAEIYYDGR